MYQTWPNKKHNKKYGKGSLADGPGGTSYPGKSLPTSQDDSDSVQVKSQHGNGKSAPGKTYPKKSVSFPKLAGLPS